MTETLTRYLKSIENTPYELYTQDCLILTNSCWRIVYGNGWCDDWLGVYPECPNGVNDLGFDSVPEAIDSKLQRTLFPMDNSLVAIKTDVGPLGYGLGFSYGGLCHFVGPKGLVKLSNRLITLSWIPYA